MSLLLATGLLLGAAHAQDFIRTEGTDCDENAVPIAGTAGFDNTRQAFRTTAQTYSAAAYAERHLFEHEPADGEGGGFSTEVFTMTRATQIVTYERRAGIEANCPRDYRVSIRPVDLQAVALGGVYQNNRFSAYYAASVAYGNPAMPNNIVRGMLLFAEPIYAMGAAMAAPLTRSGFMTQVGASAFAMDWVAGVSYTTELGSARAGYAGSRGLYANLAENRAGLFLSGLLGGADTGGGALGFVKTGVDRFDWTRFAEPVGLTSLYLRDLPYGIPASPTAETDGGLLSQVGRLRTGHVEQANLGRVVDLGATYAFAPVARLYDATLAVHTPGWVPPRLTGGDAPEAGMGFNARVGMVDLPGQPVLGLEGGRRLTLRVDVGGQMAEMDGGDIRIAFSGLLNDPEVLALYPYSVGAFTLRYQLDGSF